jgi:periplasmic divalent cation tolerance protein
MNNPNSKKFVLLYTLTNTEKSASEIAHSLVELQLAACVNVFPGIQSFYKWNGIIQNENEYALLIKTSDDVKDLCLQHLKSVHPYEIPALVELQTADINHEFYEWVLRNVRKESALD